MSFFSKKEVEQLFKNFEIMKFDEIEVDGSTALRKQKHWHFFDVIAKKTYFED